MFYQQNHGQSNGVNWGTTTRRSSSQYFQVPPPILPYDQRQIGTITINGSSQRMPSNCHNFTMQQEMCHVNADLFHMHGFSTVQHGHRRSRRQSNAPYQPVMEAFQQHFNQIQGEMGQEINNQPNMDEKERSRGELSILALFVALLTLASQLRSRKTDITYAPKWGISVTP